MKQIINWQPETELQAKIIPLALKLGQSPEIIISEAVNQYLENTVKKPENEDPLIGLFESSPDLATESENILQQEIIK